MRVLTVGNVFPPHAFGGGYEAVWESAVRHLEANGHTVRVLTSEHREGEDLPEAADAHRELRWYWHDHAYPPRSTREALGIERHNLAVIEVQLADFEPDVVSWWSMGGLSLSLLEAVRRRGLPAVAFVHDDWLDYGRRADLWHLRARRRRYPAPLVERLLGVPGRISFDAAAHYAFVSETTRAHAIRRGLPLTDTSVVHSGIGSAFERAPGRAWEGRLVYVGRIDPRKGIATAIEALVDLPEATLRVVGDGPPDHLAELDRLVASLDLRARVDFAGPAEADQLPFVYAGADAVVFPVIWREPWGLVPLEAMACGRPVVATGRGGSGEYLVDEENALLFPAGDAPALTHQIQRLSESEQLRERLVACGLETASRHTATGFDEAVERALQSRAVGRRGLDTGTP